jgi:hypothetical protein
VTVWQAWADESGTQEGSEYCAVLGYVGSPSQWRQFKRDWRAALGKRITEFHAVDFFQTERWQSTKSYYHGWSEKKAKRFLDSLLRTINRYDVRPIGFVYHVPDFLALEEKYRRQLTGAVNMTRTRVHGGDLEITDKFVTQGSPNRPYFLGFHYFITEAIKATPKGVTINFTFDTYKNVEPRALETFNEIRQFADSPLIREKMGLLSYGDSRRYEPLQAADLYSYAINRGLQGSISELLIHAIIKLARKRDQMGIARADDYQKMVKHLDEQRRAAVLRALGASNTS